MLMLSLPFARHSGTSLAGAPSLQAVMPWTPTTAVPRAIAQVPALRGAARAAGPFVTTHHQQGREREPRHTPSVPRLSLG